MLKNKQFLFLVTGTFFSTFGDAVLFVVLLSMLQGFEVNGLSTSIYFIVSTLPFLLFSLHIGAFVEKRTLQKIMMSSDLSRVVLLLVFYFLLFFSVTSVYLIYVLLFSVVFVNLFFTTASTTLMPKIIETEDIPKANSTFRVITMTSKLIAYSFVALLFKLSYSTYQYLLVIVVFYLASFILTSFVRPYFKNIEGGAEKVSLSTSVKEGLVYIKGDKVLGRLFLIFGLGWMVGSSIDLYLIGYLKEVLGKGADSLYLVTTPTIIGTLIGAIISPILYRNIKKKYGFVCSLIAFSLAILCFALELPVVILQVLLMVGGISQGILNIFLVSYLQLNVPSMYLARVFSVYSLIAMGGSIPGYLLFGFLLDKIGVISLGFWLSGYLLLIGIICLLSMPSLEEKEITEMV